MKDYGRSHENGHLLNVTLPLTCLLTSSFGQSGGLQQSHGGIFTGPIPWPIWPTLGWGLGVAFNYFDAYSSPDKQSAIEREYEKLKSRDKV